MTGSSGADNSTDNTTTFKQGGGNSDVTAQNLLADGAGTNVLKIWTIADLSSAGTVMTATEPFGLWLYILDAAALAKFKTSGTALEIKFGSSAGNYYSKTFTVSTLAVGWNWITSGTTAVNGLTETGTVAGAIDEFIIEVTTNNAGDEFAAGDLVYDLLRQWATSDLVKNIEASTPTFDTVNNKVTLRGELTATQANGFDLNGAALFNTDSPDLMTDADDYTSESKSDTDEIVYIWTNQET